MNTIVSDTSAREALKIAREAIQGAALELQRLWGEDEGDDPILLDALAKIEGCLSSSPSASVGYILVSRDPTDAELDAGRFAYKDHVQGKRGISRADVAVIWSAMLSATPSSEGEGK